MTVQSNGYEPGYVKVRASRYSFFQKNTLVLDGEGGYTLTKSLTTEGSDPDPLVRIEYTFYGTYSGEETCTLSAAERGDASISWGDIAMSTVFEEGKFSSEARPGILNYFSTGFLSQRARNEAIEVTLADGTFAYAEDGAIPADLPDGNAEEYDVSAALPLEERPLEGKTFYWLGSSVTYGSEAGGTSMADYIAKRQGATCVKDAVSGTTMYSSSEEDTQSYIARLMNSTAFDKDADVDAFICQISTNDVARQTALRMGSVTPDDKKSMEDFDIYTSLGAVEAIICYVQETWNCPVIFYAGTYFSGENGYYYEQLIEEIEKLENKWGVTVLDMYHDAEMSALDNETYWFYMSDAIHPKKAGYLEWWTPVFEEKIAEVLASDEQ